MSVLVTGAAGFIGYHVALALLERGEAVVGIDDLNAYYDVGLKKARLAGLEAHAGFAFHKLDISDKSAVAAMFEAHPDMDRVVHMAAQAGVRHSLIDPYAYTRCNVEGQLVLLEAARRQQGLKHFVFASSSSVYGANTELPFSVRDRVNTPVSLYAATKRSAELMSRGYAHVFRLPQTGLRFFTVYGPWGRPDMAAFIFARKILAGEPIPVFNHGDMRRDFTYVDDVVQGVVASLDRPPADGGVGKPPFALYNLGNHKAEALTRFIKVLEQALGKKATVELLPMQPGDVKETYADIAESQRDLGFEPRIGIEEGLARFVAWYRDYLGD